MAKKMNKIDFYKNLSWDNLKAWAGSKIVSRGRDYQKSGQVEDLALTPDEALIAWVSGTHRYATLVDVQKGELVSDCNCPYDDTCKHAVAVVLEGLEYLKKNKEIPLCSKKDRRLETLDSLEMEDEFEEGWEEEDEEEEEEEEEEVSIPRKASPALKSKSSVSFQAFLEDQTKPQLINLIQELAKTIPEINQALEDRQALSKGTIHRMIQSIRNEINELSSEPGWRSHWKDEGYTPDYSKVQERLKALLDQGYADEVVSLGKELLEAGISQVGMSDDDGETAMEISPCLEIVFRALSKSTLPTIQQMLWAVDAELMDEYGLCQDLAPFWEHKFSKEDWSNLADILIKRLNGLVPTKKEDEFSRNYGRDSLSNWIVRALEKAGRQKEIIPLCEQEAGITGSYTRLVNQLMEANRLKEAEQWIQKGFKATQQKWPGIAQDLRNITRKIREKEGNQLQVTSFRAEEFFDNPTLITFQELQKAAGKAKVWPKVKAAALQFLETGKQPQKSPSWPLPVCEIPLENNRQKMDFPILHTLIDIAIEEKDPAKVLLWYDRQKPSRFNWGGGSSQEMQVAKAVVDEYPDRAVAIWKKLAENLIAQTKPKAYEEAAVHLRKVNHILKKLNRPKDWQIYLLDVRQKNIRKIRLIEILDSLDGGRIIEGIK